MSEETKQLLHNHPQDVIDPAGCPLCRLNEAAPALLDACKYGLNLTLNGVGQHTHAIALFEAAIALAEKEQ